MQTQSKKSVAVLLLSVCLGSFAWSQGETATSTDDSIFNDGGDQTAQPTTAPNPMDASGKKPLSISASFYASGGIMPGWNTWDNVAKGFEGASIAGGVTLSSIIGFTARFSPSFSVQGGMTLVYPNSADAINNPKGELNYQLGPTPLFTSFGLFALSTNDIFADYAIANTLFLKLGRFSQTWGNSYFFKSSDIINRYIPNTTADGLRLKLSAPIGPVNVSVMGQAFNAYFSNLGAINASDLGYALHLDMPIGPVEVGLGGFFQKQLTPRGMFTLKSSVSPIDFFCDVTLAFDYNGAAYPRTIDIVNFSSPTNTAYLCISTGLYGDIKEIESQFYLEYLYNGERRFIEETRQWVNMLPDSYQPGGHNLSLLWRWKRSNNSAFQPLAQISYNFSDNSAVIVPGLVVYITDNLKMQLGVPIYLDSNHNALMSGEAGYLSSNILQGHTIGLALAITLSGTASMD